jgi:HSP20 family molecular chaperone IbpA
VPDRGSVDSVPNDAEETGVGAPGVRSCTLNFSNEKGSRENAEAELPELELSDLEIFVNGDNQLSIKGERRQPKRENGMWHRQERRHGSFSRTGELPQYGKRPF